MDRSLEPCGFDLNVHFRYSLKLDSLELVVRVLLLYRVQFFRLNATLAKFETMKYCSSRKKRNRKDENVIWLISRKNSQFYKWRPSLRIRSRQGITHNFILNFETFIFLRNFRSSFFFFRSLNHELSVIFHFIRIWKMKQTRAYDKYEFIFYIKWKKNGGNK